MTPDKQGDWGGMMDAHTQSKHRCSGVEQARGEHAVAQVNRQGDVQAPLHVVKAQHRSAQAGGLSGRATSATSD